MPQTDVRALAASLLVRDVEQGGAAVMTVDGSKDPLTAEEQLLAFRKEWLGEWSKAADEIAELKAEVTELKDEDIAATFKGAEEALSPTAKAFGAMVEEYMSPASDGIKTEAMKELNKAAQELDDEVVESILVDALGLSRPTEEFGFA